MHTNNQITSAIFAGLGALKLRSHLRSLNEISDLNKQRLGVAGRAGLVGVVGTSIYKKLYRDDPKRINIYNSAIPIKTISNRQYDPTLYNQIQKLKGEE